MLFIGFKIAKSNLSESVRNDLGASFALNDIIKRKPPYLKALVSSSLQHLQELYNIGQLELRYSNNLFLKGSTRLLVEMHEVEDDLGDVLKDILKFFDWLRDKFDNDINKTAENYLELYSLLDSLLEFHKLTPEIDKNLKRVAKSTDKISNELIKEIQKIKKSFNKLSAVRKIVQASDYKK